MEAARRALAVAGEEGQENILFSLKLSCVLKLGFGTLQDGELLEWIVFLLDQPQICSQQELTIIFLKIFTW